MNLEEKLKQDIVKALKEKQKVKLTVLRMVKGAVDLEYINTKKEITDDTVITVINKQIKMRNDSIEEFKKANRNDLVEATQEEVNILMEYLPEQLTNEELDELLTEVFDEVKPESAKDMGKIMQKITPLVKGKADMKLVSEKIKDRLA